jgi:hypothetical protein
LKSEESEVTANVPRVELEQVVEAQQQKQVLDRQWVGKFKAQDETPSVKNVEKFRAGNIDARNITYFDEGQEGQTIAILGDGFSTLVYDVARIITSTAANKLMVLNKVYWFTCWKIGTDLVWVEDA